MHLKSPKYKNQVTKKKKKKKKQELNAKHVNCLTNV